MGTELLSFEIARARLLATARRTGVETVDLAEASGRVLASDLVAPLPLPPFDHSAMDGYAVASRDFTTSGPWTLAVHGESRAGSPAPALVPGSACRIFTGAPLPPDADAVVMQENARREGDTLHLDQAVRAGQHVRRAGEDLAKGHLALAAGTRLSAGALALAAMCGTGGIPVLRRPRVTVLCTGDELRRAGDVEQPGTIFESNSVALAALARQAGAEVRIAPIVRDDPDATHAAVRAALEGTDLLLTVGGVSVGDHDVVRPSLERAGASLDFWRVAIKPGKPLAVGRTPSAHVMGLPGNPASALVTFAVFGMPLLRAMQGDARPLAPVVRLAFDGARKRSPDRLEITRASVVLKDGAATLGAHDNQSSGAATSLAHSEGLAFVPAGEGPLAAGTSVDFMRWSDA